MHEFLQQLQYQRAFGEISDEEYDAVLRQLDDMFAAPVEEDIPNLSIFE